MASVGVISAKQNRPDIGRASLRNLLGTSLHLVAGMFGQPTHFKEIEMNDNMPTPKLLRVPVKCQSLDMIFGTVKQLEGLQHVLVIVEDQEGCWIIIQDGTTLERMNWMLDRAKFMVHE